MLGPLGNPFCEVFPEQRLSWWKLIFGKLTNEDIQEFKKSYVDLQRWATALDSPLVVWAAENATDYMGLRCLAAYLPDSVPVSVVMLTRAYQKQFQKFKPRAIGEVDPEKLFSLLQEARPLSQEVREVYALDWGRLLEEDGRLRILDEGRLKTVSVDTFDSDIIRLASDIYHEEQDAFPALRLIGDVIANMEQPVRDVFIDWRIRTLIHQGIFSYTGSFEQMHLYWIRPNGRSADLESSRDS